MHTHMNMEQGRYQVSYISPYTVSRSHSHYSSNYPLFEQVYPTCVSKIHAENYIIFNYRMKISKMYSPKSISISNIK